MTSLVTNLLQRINNIAPPADEDLLKEMMTTWSGHTTTRAIRESLRQWLVTTADLDRLRVTARETSTHYVWPLVANANGYSLVINEFKHPQEMMAGYAKTLHDHRYSFVSLLLSGGYTQVRSDIEMLGTGQAYRISDLSRDILTESDIVAINHAEFHRLVTISERTVTLVARCPAVKGESLSVDPGTRRVTRHVPVEARVRHLIQALVPGE